MSRRRRDRGAQTDNILGDLEQNALNTPSPSDELTASSIANDAYGSQVLGGRSSRVRVRTVSIFDIYPDPAQPRRAVPSAVRQYWNGQPDGVADLFAGWLREIELERGGHFPLADYLAGGVTDRVPADIGADETLAQIGSEPRTGPLEASLLRIIELAASIRRDGLTNPITIVPQDRLYAIETGERRWLAYQLLNAYMPGDQDWSSIPARTVNELSIWRQASENNARRDLNAIGKARQFALLLMDVYGHDNFQPFAAFESEQGFYAQVADGGQWRIPRGEGENLLNAMALGSANQLRHVRRLLRLPAVVWQLADDLDWSENFIQKDLLARSQSEDDLIRLALRAAHRAGYSVSALTVYDHLLADEDGHNQPERPVYARGRALLTRDDRERFKRLLGLAEGVYEADDATRRALLDDIKAMENWLAAMRDNLR